MSTVGYRIYKVKQHCRRLMRLSGGKNKEIGRLAEPLTGDLHPYQMRDREIISYDISELKLQNGSLKIRGRVPENLSKGTYTVCLGAAQTFGCYVENPYPSLLSEKIGFPIVNLGQGGASARFFLENDGLMDFINNSKFAVLQIMAARGQENSMVKMAATQSTVIRRDDSREVDAFDFYQKLFRQSVPSVIQKVVNETRESWTKDMEELLKAIKVPTVLFWISKRKPAYTEHYSKSGQLLEAVKTPLDLEKFTFLGQLFQDYPQLVNDSMVSKIRSFSSHYAECVSDRGWPQVLKSKTKGSAPIVYEKGKKIEKRYNGYPSPEMHEDAANVLAPICKKFVNHE